jgi:glycosyltransferase involved in cell wall biosynthesis
VVARAEGAVAETVDGAGLLLDRDRPSLVAGVVERVLTDPDLRARLVAGGRRRTAALSPAVVARRAVAALATVAGPPPGPPAGTVAAA